MADNPEVDDDNEVGPVIPEFLRRQSEDAENDEDIGPTIPAYLEKSDNEKQKKDVDLPLKNNEKNDGEKEDEESEPEVKKPRFELDKESDENIFKAPESFKEEKKLKFEETYLRSLPKASQYEKSFMHRDTVSHVFSTMTDFIITASIDGHLKFWKKIHNEGVEFVKHFRCFLHSFSDISINYNGTLMVTVCTEENAVKIFDIVNFDMINMFKFPFSPKIATWVHVGSDPIQAIAISDANSNKIYVYDSKGENAPIHLKDKLHRRPVTLMEYIPSKNIVISIDEKGMIEYWSGIKTNFDYPNNVSWKFKTDTDLYEFAKIKQAPKSLCVSTTGNYFATLSHDRILRIFDVDTGKIIKKIDETLTKYNDEAKLNDRYGIPNVDWTRKVALEKDINRDHKALDNYQMSFDESGNFLIYPSPVGIRIYNIVTEKIVRNIGKLESVRYTGIALCRALPTTTERFKGAAVTAEIIASDNPALRKADPDPMIIAKGYKKNRFYIFTNAEPFNTTNEEGATNRDVFNEKPRKEDALTAVAEKDEKSTISDEAVIHTTLGDISVKLFTKECLKTTENFVTHARRGYYNGHIFHRIVKSFIIQTGDPTGKGTGGQSIWGGEFEDEFHPMLRYDKPFRLAMANAGPNTNGSQFFITVVPADFLDGKNTLFGEVTDGFSVVQKINNLPVVEKTGRPREEVSIVSITLKN